MNSQNDLRCELWKWAWIGPTLGILGFGFVSLGEAYVPLGLVCGTLGGVIVGYVSQRRRQLEKREGSPENQ